MAKCYFCGSDDSMHPFRRSSKVWLLTRLWPRLRRLYCRSCARHFLSLGSVNHTAESGTPAPMATLDEVIAQHIKAALLKTNGRIDGPDGAAELLRVPPRRLRAHMSKFGISEKVQQDKGGEWRLSKVASP